MTTVPDIATMDDVRKLLKTLPGPDLDALGAAAEREPQLTKPPGALGRLEELASWAAAWQGRYPPSMKRINVHVFAGNHGVVDEGVSAFPAAVTTQMVKNFEAGGAAINQMCNAVGAGLCVEAMDLENPTANFTQGPAMSDAECVDAMRFGMKVIDKATDLVCLGEMGIGNTTSAAALALALYGGSAATWTGPGTGIDEKTMAHKAEVVSKGVRINQPHIKDGLDALRCLGGREMAAIAGAVIGARLKRVPVMLDGYVCTAAAAALLGVDAKALGHCKVGHVSQEPGHTALLKKMNKKPLLDFNMRLGEGSGAALAASILKSAVECHNNMATFDEAGVSGKD